MTKQEAIEEFKKNTTLQIELYKEWSEFCSWSHKKTLTREESSSYHKIYDRARSFYKRNNQLIWKYQIQFIKRKVNCGKYHVRWFYFPIEDDT